jgi:hypothetical protein
LTAMLLYKVYYITASVVALVVTFAVMQIARVVSTRVVTFVVMQ